MRLHPLTSTFQLIMRPHPVMNKRQQTYFHSLKNYNVLTFGRFSLNTNRGRRSASPLIQTWLIESEVLPYLSYLVMIEGGRERRPLRCQFCLLLSSSDSHRVTLPFITTRRMHKGVIFPRHNIYIYIYIYNVPGDQSSISGRFIPKTPKMVLDSSFLNTQHYKVRFKGRD